MINIPPTHPFRSSLDASWKEGIPANIMLVILDYYLIPYALFLGASVQEIGLLVAVPSLLGSLAQLTAVKVVKTIGSRLRCLIAGAFLQALILGLLASMTFLSALSFRMGIFIFSVSLFRILGNLIGTAWGSLVSEYLTPTERGWYLGWRSQMAGMAGIFGFAIAGIWLQTAIHFSPSGGFCSLFIVIALCRVLSAVLFKKMTDLPFEEKPESHFTFLLFLKRFRESNFVTFVLFVAAMTFGTQLAAPYFSVYMLKDLRMNYVTYMSIHMASVLASLISFPVWGRHADRIGNAKVLKTASFLVPWIPLMWLFSSNWLYLIGVEFFSGFVWGGFSLCAANFIYDAVSPEKRIRCLGYFNFINGLALFSAATLGGFLATRLPPLRGHPILALFLISATLRFVVHFALSGKFREVRQTKDSVSSIDLFLSVLGLRPMAGRNKEILIKLRKPTG